MCVHRILVSRNYALRHLKILSAGEVHSNSLYEAEGTPVDYVAVYRCPELLLLWESIIKTIIFLVQTLKPSMCLFFYLQSAHSDRFAGKKIPKQCSPRTSIKGSPPFYKQQNRLCSCRKLH